jgi:hypothetical protein
LAAAGGGARGSRTPDLLNAIEAHFHSWRFPLIPHHSDLIDIT